MAPAPYPDFNWFVRAVRVLPVVAGAALIGGAIGGASVFAVDSALTAPPRQDLRAEISKNNVTAAATEPARSPAASPQTRADSPPSAPSPIRTIDAPVINPSPATITPAPVQALTAPTVQAAQPTPQTQVQAAPAQPTAWPDALSRTHIQTPAAAEAATPPSTPAAALVPDSPGQDESARAAANQPAESHTVADPKSAAGPAPAKRRVLISRTKPPQGDNVGESADNTSAKARRVYDYYGDARDDGDRDDQDAATRSGGTALANVHLPRGAHDARTAPKTRVATKRQVQLSSDRSDRSAAPQLPPQPRPSFLDGLFGGGDRDDNSQ